MKIFSKPIVHVFSLSVPSVMELPIKKTTLNPDGSIGKERTK